MGMEGAAKTEILMVILEIESNQFKKVITKGFLKTATPSCHHCPGTVCDCETHRNESKNQNYGYKKYAALYGLQHTQLQEKKQCQ